MNRQDLVRIVLLICFFCESSIAQEINQVNYGLVKFPLPNDVHGELISSFPQNLYLHNGNLYVVPDGTGRIYLLNYRMHKPIVRLDSTIYFGFTFGSQIFFHGDTLFAFGGYGYWHTNGLLRFYLPKTGGWELEPLNREIPFHKTTYLPMIWFDNTLGQLWLGYSIDHKEGIKHKGREHRSLVDSVYVLDMDSKEFRLMGLMSGSAKEVAQTTSVRLFASSPWGQMILDSNKGVIYLFDYSKNRQLILNEKITRELLRIVPPNGWLHFVDSTLIIQSGSDWLAGALELGDSIVMSKSDFIQTGESIYEAPPTIASNLISRYLYAIVIFLGGCIFAGLVLYAVIIRPANVRLRIKESQMITFDEREKEVIVFVAQNSISGTGTNVEQINQILGVGQKSLEIQKKQRSDLFLSINQKWSKVYSEHLIVKRRLEEDKRSFKYHISVDQLNKLESLNILVTEDPRRHRNPGLLDTSA